MTLRFDWDVGKQQAIVSGDLFDEVREHFSVHNDAATFARRRGRYIPSRTYVITPSGRFDIGLYDEIRKYILDNQYVLDITLTDEFQHALTASQSFRVGDDQISLNLSLRPYQKEAVESCLQNGRGVVQLATGGGKTIIMAYLLENAITTHPGFKCVVVVPDLSLVTQTFKNFDDYGVSFTFSKWTGNDELNLGTDVIICNMGILQSSKSDTDWLSHVDVFVVDEVHKLRRGNKINKLVNKIHTPHRFGFTGTMPEGLLDQWNIIGKIGSVIYDKNSYDLRQKKFISRVKVQILNLEYKNPPSAVVTNNPTDAYRRELEFISNSSFRNNILSTLCQNFDNNALVMVDYLEHGEKLYDLLQQECKSKEVFYIRGEVGVDERERVRQLMEERSNIVIVAISKIFSTGIDIKNLHYIIFASGGKAKVKTIQSIGRGLRLHKDKKELIILDIADRLTYGTRHAMKRKQFYTDEKITYGIQTIKQK